MTEYSFSTPMGQGIGIVKTWYDGQRRGTWVCGRFISDMTLSFPNYSGPAGLMHAFVDLMIEEKLARNLRAMALKCRLGYFKRKGKPSQAWVNVTVRRYRRK